MEAEGNWIPIAAVAISALCMILLVLIAYQQKRTMERQVRLTAFDKRFEVFEAFMEYITDVSGRSMEPHHNSHNILRLRPHVQFLFHEEIEELIETTYETTHELETRALEYRNAEANSDEQLQAYKRHEEAEDRFRKVTAGAPEKFRKYMNLRNI